MTNDDIAAAKFEIKIIREELDRLATHLKNLETLLQAKTRAPKKEKDAQS